ncbi:MAG: hypothetical protein Q8Q14_14785 [Gemmatimonadales bacterium]|nr:hypothetical protein [Gemmatimonadales bacterium]
MARRKRAPADPDLLTRDAPPLDPPSEAEVADESERDGDGDGEAAGGSDAPPREPTFATMTDEEKEHYIQSLQEQGRGEDAQVARARFNAEHRRHGARTAELERIHPEEDEEGTPITGLQKTFHPPFSDLNIRDYARRILGGGLYQITFYNGDGKYMSRERFRIPGPPRLWIEQHKRAKEEEPAPEPVEGDDAPSARELALESRFETLIKMIAERDKRETEDRRDREHRAEMAKLEEKLERLTTAAPKANNLAETIAALGTALAPVMKAFAEKTGARDDRQGEMKAMTSALQAAAESSRTQMLEIMKMQGKGPMDDALGKLVNTVILERLKPSADPQTFAFSMLNKVIPDAVKSSIEMARAAASGGGTDESVVERVVEMMGPIVEKMMGRGGAGPGPGPGAMMPATAMLPGPMAPYGIPPMLPTAGMPPGYGYQGYRPQGGYGPQGPYGSPYLQAMPGVWPYTQAGAPGAPGPMPGQVPTVAPGQPMPPYLAPAPVAPMMPTGPALPPGVTPPPGYAPGISPTGMVPGQQMPVHGAMPHGPVPVAGVAPVGGAPDPAASYIHPSLFVLMLNFLAQHKSGDDLAETVDDQIETVRTGQNGGPALMSEDAVGFIEEFEPETIAPRIWEACPPELLQRFVDPTSGAVRPEIQEFVLDFLHYFYDDDEDESDGAGDAALPPSAA